jgi:glucose/arabinose dehydrogenase
MSADGAGMSTRATRVRNAIALAVNPSSGHLWAGGAGQDDLPVYHPYEFMDDVTAHAGVADYGWPDCEEDHVAYTAGAKCGSTVEPLLILPAYSTITGATFYPATQTGPYTFVSSFLGGIFLSAHGSWHTPGGCNVPPQVAFFAMNGDAPHRPASWTNADWQWTTFVSGFQPGCSSSTRIGRPTGLAVGPQGSLFVGDDQTGEIYRVRRT